MNIKKVISFIGIMMMIESILMILPFIVSIIYKESDGKYFSYVGLPLLVIGFLLYKFFKTDDDKFYSAEGFVTVSIGWIVLSVCGALPFCISKAIPNFIDSLFETVSGFTTTGATILTDVTQLSNCMLFWRSFTHFVGGMGVLVLMLAIIPTKSENMHIMKAESPGPKVGKLVSKVSDTARTLYLIYVVLTIITILSYKLSGMPLFDSICIGFGTAGTGGFVVTKNGCADYNTFSQTLIGIYMLIFGVNFNIYYLILIKKIKDALCSEELRVYLGIVFMSIVLIVFNIYNLYNSIGESIHNAFFHVSSIITTTGYAISDYTIWHDFSQVMLLLLMICGACAGSTAGGLKVSRVVISVKSAINELYMQLHPNSVKVITFEDKVVDKNTKNTVMSYVIIYILICLLGILLISLDDFDFTTTVSSVIETFNNVGLGLSKIGPKGNFSIFNQFSKVVFVILMLTGRLEIFPMIILFSKNTWKRST
ncbi:MAG: TrkH family potassium uptake protein [Lachnospiraceae bacterium]|nr:TrkH family potassium uptake protein [Lachnospiraceae bacterium]